MTPRLFPTARAAALLVAGLGFAFAVSNFARATTLATCPDCDGDTFAITYFLDSDDGTTSIFDVTLLADTSGNNLGGGHIQAVAIGLSGITVEAAMDAAPNGAANWTGQGGGLSGNGGGNGNCDGNGAFICAMANSTSFDAVVPNATTAITPYEWTWDVAILDSTKGGPASVFASSAGVKIGYSDIQGHLVSDDFTFTNAAPPSEGSGDIPVPEPTPLVLIAIGMLALAGTRLTRRSVQ